MPTARLNLWNRHWAACSLRSPTRWRSGLFRFAAQRHLRAAHSVSVIEHSQIEEILAYIRLNTPVTCPPRATCPRSTGGVPVASFINDGPDQNCGRDATAQAMWKHSGLPPRCVQSESRPMPLNLQPGVPHKYPRCIAMGLSSC